MGCRKGKVFLVGAGPGDPSLITRKGAACLRQAEVVIYDRLISHELLYLAPAKAELIYVGKRPKEHFRRQDEINSILLEKACEGKRLVRLKGGDPFIFGRGAEEAAVLKEAGIPFEVVPGVTSAIAASAYAGIPLTHRDWTSSVAFVTGHESLEKTADTVCFEKIGSCIGTIVVYMGVKNFERITKTILDSGRKPDTPAAIIYAGTTPWQKTVTGNLDEISELAKRENIKPPSLLVVGEVVSLRKQLAWHEKRVLFGRRIVVTRSKTDKSLLAEGLRSLGAMVIEFPTIKISPTSEPEKLCKRLYPLQQYSWILFLSPTAVKQFFNVIIQQGGDARNLFGVKIAVRDKSTYNALRKFGIKPDYLGEKASAEVLVEGLAANINTLSGKKILVPQKAELTAKLTPLLEKKGAELVSEEVYRISLAERLPQEFIEHYEAGLIDGICFTSSNSVNNFKKLMKVSSLQSFDKKFKFFSIGPVTSEKLRRLGIVSIIEAQEHNIKGLSASISSYFSKFSK